MTLSQSLEFFPGKLLLAGEFTVLTGAAALAIPLPRISGHWNFSEDSIDPRLVELIPYLKSLHFLDHPVLEKEILSGITFESNIPQGYGLGSSGALSAAILHRYHRNDLRQKEVQKMLALIEQYFHGTSSGFDPLISFTRQAHRMKEGKAYPMASLMEPNHSSILNSFYLIDSNVARGDISSMDWYYDSMLVPSFQSTIKLLEKLNGLLIESIVNKDQNYFRLVMKDISQLQLELFRPLIVDTLVSSWEDGLRSDQYYLKLCGKGGGGYYLAWSPNVHPPGFTALSCIPAI